MVNFSRRQLIMVIGGVGVVLLLVVFVFANVRRGPGGVSLGRANLTVWGTDDASLMQGILDDYKEFSGIGDANYRQIPKADYERALLNALAAGSGPDVFYVLNHELPKRLSIIAPVGAQQFTLTNLRELFPAVVERDFAVDGQIYALPLYLDTMAMVYNKTIFDQAGVAVLPQTWDELLTVIPRLRSLDSAGRIERAAAAAGGSEKSVDAGVDLLHLLMMQNGAGMMNRGSSPRFTGGGVSALNFYLQFANAASPYYTWSDARQYSLDNFAGGGVAVIFNYQSSLDRIRARSPFLNFAVAPMLQPTGASAAINYPRYHGLAVSRSSRARSVAWDFIIYAAVRSEGVQSYLEGSGRPPALRRKIGEYAAHPELNVFAKQALTARSWYQPDNARVREIFSGAIQAALSGQSSPERALQQAEDEVEQLVR